MPQTSAMTGLRPIMDNLDRLGRSGPKIAKRALTTAIKPYVPAMKSKVRGNSKTKLLERSLGSQVKVTKTRNLVAAAGPRKGFEDPQKPGRFVRQTRKRLAPKGARRATRYADKLEKGHRRGAGRSAAKPYPFEKPVQDALKSTTEQTLARELWAGVQAEIRSA